MKYYAVKVGREIGIFESWDECLKQVSGFEGAKYKSFSKFDDAQNYLNDIKEDTNYVGPTAYVDGSFKEETSEYSFGVVFLFNGKEYYFKKSFKEDELSSMRNVAGEIKAAGFIIQFCLNRGINRLTIYHDYEGISKWYNNEWKANLYGTIKYQEFANKVKDSIEVNFVKVKSHTNVKYNEMADRLAKEALGINS